MHRVYAAVLAQLERIERGEGGRRVVDAADAEPFHRGQLQASLGGGIPGFSTCPAQDEEQGDEAEPS
jgi:hypothetical protein